MKRTFPLIVMMITMLLSCQKEEASINKTSDLDTIIFHADTVTYGDTIRLVSTFTKTPADSVWLDFISIDGKVMQYHEKIVPSPETLSDTLKISSSGFGVGPHTLTYHACTNHEYRAIEMNFVICPTSTDFIDDGEFCVCGGSSGSRRQIYKAVNDCIEIPLGDYTDIAFLTGLTSQDTKSHDLTAASFNIVLFESPSIVEFSGKAMSSFKYYYTTPGGNISNECYALTTSIYPLQLGETYLYIRFWDKERIIKLKVIIPKDEVNV